MLPARIKEPHSRVERPKARRSVHDRFGGTGAARWLHTRSRVVPPSIFGIWPDGQQTRFGRTRYGKYGSGGFGRYGQFAKGMYGRYGRGRFGRYSEGKYESFAPGWRDHRWYGAGHGYGWLWSHPILAASDDPFFYYHHGYFGPYVWAGAYTTPKVQKPTHSEKELQTNPDTLMQALIETQAMIGDASIIGQLLLESSRFPDKASRLKDLGDELAILEDYYDKLLRFAQRMRSKIRKRIEDKLPSFQDRIDKTQDQNERVDAAMLQRAAFFVHDDLIDPYPRTS